LDRDRQSPLLSESLGVAKEKIPPELYVAYEGARAKGGDDHNLDGPIAVRGAEPGDTVENQNSSRRPLAADCRDELPGEQRLAAGGFSLFARPRVFHRSR